jgi:Flp pilus assembly pilin Flp
LRRVSNRSQEVIRVRQIRQYPRQDGQTMAEYAVVLGVITAAAIAALTLLSANVTGRVMSIADLVGLGGG